MIGIINEFVSDIVSTVRSPFVGVKSVSKRVVSRKMSMKRTSSRQSRTKVLAKSKKRK